jgi:sec-independent protein translocase protein TatB
VFDVSFSELVVIAIVALIVIGPEKLPKVARTLGALTGRMQRFVAQVKDEVNRDVRFQELQQLQQEIQDSATKARDQIQTDLNESVSSLKHDLVEPELMAENQATAIPEVKKTPVKRAPTRKSLPKKESIAE